MKSIAYAIVVAACMCCTVFEPGLNGLGAAIVGGTAWIALLMRDEK